ncbi:hypothetical protein ACOME3_003781 [Neoechinorhynchus agilis]
MAGTVYWSSIGVLLAFLTLQSTVFIQCSSKGVRRNLAVSDICYDVNAKLMYLIHIDRDQYFKQIHRGRKELLKLKIAYSLTSILKKLRIDTKSEMICKSTQTTCCPSDLIQNYQTAVSAQMSILLKREAMSIRQKLHRIFKIISSSRIMFDELLRGYFDCHASRTKLFQYVNIILPTKELNATYLLSHAIPIGGSEVIRVLKNISMESYFQEAKLTLPPLRKCIRDHLSSDTRIDLAAMFDDSQMSYYSLRYIESTLRTVDSVLELIEQTKLTDSCLSSVTLMDLCVFCRTSKRGKRMFLNSFRTNMNRRDHETEIKDRRICLGYCRNVVRGCFFTHISTAQELSEDIADLVDHWSIKNSLPVDHYATISLDFVRKIRLVIPSILSSTIEMSNNCHRALGVADMPLTAPPIPTLNAFKKPVLGSMFMESCVNGTNEYVSRLREIMLTLAKHDTNLWQEIKDIEIRLSSLKTEIDQICIDQFDVEYSDNGCWFGSIHGNYSRQVFDPVSSNTTMLSETPVFPNKNGQLNELLKHIKLQINSSAEVVSVQNASRRAALSRLMQHFAQARAILKDYDYDKHKESVYEESITDFIPAMDRGISEQKAQSNAWALHGCAWIIGLFTLAVKWAA